MSAHPPAACSRCPDCPQGLDVIQQLATGENGCVLDSTRLTTNGWIPEDWLTRYSLGVVRRGVVIRQRMDAQGRAVPFDAAGPGCVLRLRPRERMAASTSYGYAATEVLLCLHQGPVLEPSSGDELSLAEGLLAAQEFTLTRVERLTQARGAETVIQKVAALLLALADTLSPRRRRDRLPADLTQRTMTRLIGVRHESFCRALRRLEADGAIERSPSGLRILDRAALLAV